MDSIEGGIISVCFPHMFAMTRNSIHFSFIIGITRCTYVNILIQPYTKSFQHKTQVFLSCCSCLSNLFDHLRLSFPKLNDILETLTFNNAIVTICQNAALELILTKICQIGDFELTLFKRLVSPF